MTRKRSGSKPSAGCTWRCPLCGGSGFVPGHDVAVLVDRGQGPRPELRSQAVRCPRSAPPKAPEIQGLDHAERAAGEREDESAQPKKGIA